MKVSPVFVGIIYFFCGTFVFAGKFNRRNSNDELLWPTANGYPPMLMAHRGEKVFMPEHTVGSYELASLERADYVEPDLVLTKDGHLVCFHDLTLASGTDVSSIDEFKILMRVNHTVELEGKNKTIDNDWLIQDFTLEQLRQLKVKQKEVGIRPQYYNTLFQIPTFEEYLTVVHKMALKQTRKIGIIPEIKHAKFHNIPWEAQGSHYMENKTLNVLKSHGYPIKTGDASRCTYTPEENSIHADAIECGHVLIQSFEIDALRYLKTQTDIDLLQLADVDYVEHLTFEGIKKVAEVAEHLSVWKELMYTGAEAALKANNMTYDEEEIQRLGGFIPAKEVVKVAHEAGLKMGLFTIYDSHEKSYRGCDSGTCDPEDKEKELFYYFALGVDGLFVENVQEAIELRTKYDNQLQLNRLRSSVATVVPTSMHLVIAVVSFLFIHL